jgi:hypothetical protein
LPLKNSLALFLRTLFVIGLFVGLISGLISLWVNPTWEFVGVFLWLIAVLNTALPFAFIAGLNRGGSAVIKHYALRLILWRNGYTPLNFVKFLDHCAKLILMKKVGGGYIFIHRMLLD